MKKMFFSCVVLFLGVAMVRPILSQESKQIDLAGQWQFQADPLDQGLTLDWHNTALQGMINLPGSMPENDLGNEITLATQWTGEIKDMSFFTDVKYEKYRQPGNIKVPFWLTPRKHYVGPAWYQKSVMVPDHWRHQRITLFLERCHWTTHLWLDGRFVGSQNSLSVPHEYHLGELVPGSHTLTVRVDNRIHDVDVGINAHSVTDHTQGNWNGIIGKMALLAFDPVCLNDVQIFPDVASKKILVKALINNATGEKLKGSLKLNLLTGTPALQYPPRDFNIKLEKGSTQVDLEFSLPQEIQLWSEFSPHVHTVQVDLRAHKYRDSKKVTFGLRQIGIEGSQFTMNGDKIFLRGTLECCIFPLTGYPPTDVESWKCIIRICKAHGLNHIRFHSWCPPEAAFTAADELGFYYQVECPAWTEIGNGKAIDSWIYDESERIVRAYGNHPSFILMAYGNEPSGPERGGTFLKRWVPFWIAKDSRRLYTGAAGWPLITENQFYSTPDPRMQAWGAELKSRINAKPPETMTDYSDWVIKLGKPIISHEIGQWCVYPNFAEIEKYTGVNRAANFEIFRDQLNANHMGDQAYNFLMASGKLQALCYKEDIEAALRTPGFAGFQLLDLHDFPGQGTALVGVLDAFWESKGYISANEYRCFCNSTVPLARLSKRIWTNDEIFSADLEIAHFGPEPLLNAIPSWTISDERGNLLKSSELSRRNIRLGNGITLGRVEFPLINLSQAQKLILTVSIMNTPFSNHWDFWVYPKALPGQDSNTVVLSRLWDQETQARLMDGASIFFMPAKKTVRGKVPPGFSPIFWNTAWTNNQAPHTLGILCDPGHPALTDFPTEFHSNWQWWDLITHAQIIILDDLPADLRPVVQVIDDWFSNRRLGLVFECRVGKGKLLVCGIDLERDLAIRPVAKQMLFSLQRYMTTPAFDPKLALTPAQITAFLLP